ncbi:MAG: hypothetical protein JNL74_03975, partial [Fibrobacteres bacterium]|nr:hypothetical protein [Fibrobacterota bacterium]
RNSIIYGRMNTGLMISNSGNAYNNTIYGMTSGTGVNSTTANTVIRNVVSLGSLSSWVGTTGGTSSNNTGEMSVLGSSAVITAAAAEFTNVALGNEDFRLLYGANSVNRGADLSGTGFSDDIIGDARPFNGTWDVGAYEYRRLTLSKSDSTTSSVSFSYVGGSSLEVDEDSIFVWLTPVKSSIGVGAATDTILKSNLTTVQTYSGLSTATLYYVGTIVKSNAGAWGAPVIDSIYVKIGSPLQLNLTSSTLYGELHIVHPNRATISPNVDSVIVYYRGGGYNLNPYAASVPGRDTAFTRAQFVAMDTLKVKNLPTGTNTYFVSSTLIDNLYGQSYRSLIPGNSPNDTAQVTTSYDYPSNFLSLNPMSSDTNSILLSVDRLCDAKDSLNIAGVYLFHASSADSALLATQYRTMTVIDSIPRTGVTGFLNDPICSTPRTMSALADGEKHYFGVATRNSLGYWSRNVNIMSFWTRPKNSLRLAIAPTPALGDSGVVCTLYNAKALPLNADSIQVFIGVNAAKDAALGPDTAFNIANFSGSDTLVFTRKAMASNTKFYFTARAGLSTNTNSATRWGVIDVTSNPGNWDTLTTPDFRASTTPDLQLGPVSATQANFYVPSQTNYSAITDSVIFFVETDSANLVNNWKSLTPWSITDTLNSRIMQHVDTLTNGGTYWIGVASRSKQRIWSAGISIQKIETNVIN